MIGVVLLTSIFFFFTVGCILEIPHSPIGRWLLAHFDWCDLCWHWLLASLRMMPCSGEWWAARKTSSFCYLSCTYCLDTPLSLDTHFQGGLAKCASTLNWRDKSELQPATNMASLLLSMIGRKCKTHFCSHRSMHNFALIRVLFTLDVLGVVREG